MLNHPHDLDPRDREVLGEVTIPSGILVVLDMGLLPMWCHDRPPTMPEGILDAEAMTSADAAVDFRIEGPDAERAGRDYDRQWHPLYLFDIPGRGVEGQRERFDRFASERGLDARLVPLPARVAHRRRVDVALGCGAGAGEVQYHGLWAVAAGDVPPDRPLGVYGERMPEDGPDEGRWRRIWVECRPGAPVVRSEPIGRVMVDEARLILADADALGHWRHEEPCDGLADVVLWGRDAEQVARAVDAVRLAEDRWGWLDLPAEDAAGRGMAVQRLRDEGPHKFALDFRPHSHHHGVMEQVRGSATESGTIEVGGAILCGFMTTWGDGIFPVERDLDAGGRLVRLRIELGCEAIVARQRRFEEWWSGAFARRGVVSRRVFEEGQCVRFLYREGPDDEDDSGWRVFAGGENRSYCDDAANFQICPLRELIQRDRRLEDLLRSPTGSVFERERCDGEFRPVDDFDPTAVDG